MEPTPDDSISPPASANTAEQETATARGSRRRRRRFRRRVLFTLGAIALILTITLYAYYLLRGPRTGSRKWQDELGATLEAPQHSIRIEASDDEDAVRRKLLSKRAPSPTLTGIARHEASRKEKPAGPAYDEDGSNLPLSHDELVPHDPLTLEAAQALEAYCGVKDWHQRLPLIFHAETTDDRMRTYYEEANGADPERGEMVGATLISSGESKVILLRYKCLAWPDALLTAYFHRAPSGRLLLDWEAWVGWSQLPLPTVKKTRTLIPTLMRVVASESSYYNYEFSDEARFLAVKLRSPDGLHSITGYVLRKSLLGIAIGNLIGVPLPSPVPGGLPLPPLRRPGTKAAITLRIAFPPTAQSDHCVMITEIVADRWLLFPGEEK